MHTHNLTNTSPGARAFDCILRPESSHNYRQNFGPFVWSQWITWELEPNLTDKFIATDVREHFQFCKRLRAFNDSHPSTSVRFYKILTYGKRVAKFIVAWWILNSYLLRESTKGARECYSLNYVPQKVCWSPFPQYIRMWPYLEIGSLQKYLRWGHTGRGWAFNSVWLTSF